MKGRRARLLLGLEAELGFTVLGRDGRRVPNPSALGRFIGFCQARLAYLPNVDRNRLYLANGSLIYPDCGHPEFATAECSSPIALLESLRAGEALLTEVAADIAALSEVSAVHLYRTNVDYGVAGVTWGCHENYLSRRHPLNYARSVVPHLMSRVVYTGETRPASTTMATELVSLPM